MIVSIAAAAQVHKKQIITCFPQLTGFIASLSLPWDLIKAAISSTHQHLCMYEVSQQANMDSDRLIKAGTFKTPSIFMLELVWWMHILSRKTFCCGCHRMSVKADIKSPASMLAARKSSLMKPKTQRSSTDMPKTPRVPKATAAKPLCSTNSNIILAHFDPCQEWEINLWILEVWKARW